jgi:excisionase family DNA binding protein
MAHGETSDRFLAHLGQALAAALEAAGVDLAGGTGQAWMGIQAAANYLDIGETKFRELVSAGKLPAPIDIGGRPKYSRKEIDRAIDRLRRAQA